MSAPADLREMTADDAAWAAGLMERRRQVASPGYLALRTGHGFLIGQRRGQEGCAMLTALGLELAEQWWVRELAPAPVPPGRSPGPASPAGSYPLRLGCPG